MILYSTIFGSHLYGTNVSTSDYDYKHIVLPDLNDMLIGKPLKNVVKQTNKGKNTNQDSDNEYIPIQIYARHFLEGQIYTLEIAFSVNRQTDLTKHQMFERFNKELIEMFLTSNANSIIGYSIAQSHLYSDKSERYNELMLLKPIINSNQFKTVADLANHNDFLELIKNTKHIKISTYEIGHGVYAPCIEVIDKVLPFTMAFTNDHALGTFKRLFSRYGERTKSSTNNVDWKATSHAIRILNEGIELFETGKITLPILNSAQLIEIRKGNVEIELIKHEFSEKLERLKALSQSNNLKSFTPELKMKFDEWLGNWMKEFYFKG